jgi:acyl-CoA synthetase (NDP forming)
MNLQRLLEARSVAIVGASAEPKKISGMIVDFLLKSGYAGRIYPINPRYDKIRDMTCYPSVDALPDTVDLLVCVVPVAVAFESIEAAARRGVPFCLLMTGGFGEGRTGAAGEARRERLLALCRESGMHVVGPNTVGMVNFLHRMPLTFADWYGRDTGQRGGVAIVTHSGSVGGLTFSSLQLNGIGVNYWIGLGNEATLETADFISHFSDDPGIHTVICYMEGLQKGRNFMAAAEKARRAGKHVVVVKAGDHPESARSTLSHTGKNPADGDVYAGAFRQLGVIQVASLSELTYVMTLLTTVGERLGSRVGIISASGGANSLIADHVINAGLELPQLPDALQATLNKTIPEYGSSLNPVDLSADVIARPEILHGTLDAIRTDASVDVWMVFGRPIIDRYYETLIEFSKSSTKAMIVCCGVPLPPEIHAALRKNGVAVLTDPELCLRALARIQRAMRPHMREAMPAKPAQLELARASAPVLSVAIEHDRDFGDVIALSAATPFARACRRVVRVLPVSLDDLHDAMHELAAIEGGLPASADDIAAALHAIVQSHTSGSAARIDLTVEDGLLRRCALHT